MSKRIYELSKELAEELGIPIPNSELIDLIRKELPDLPVKQASSNVTGLYVEDIKEIARRAFAKPQSPPPPPPSTEDNSPQNSSIQKRTGKRIYELNKEIADKYGINVSNRDLIDCICKGFPDLVLKQSSSNIPAERIDGVVAYLRKKLGGKASPSTGETPPPPPAPRPSPAVKSGTP
ncbi:MAG: hypothetical protein LBS59_07380, partial [Puniceicoccales bacterium]|nr:hypothetical protein [Puniceicoccales bacterium]